MMVSVPVVIDVLDSVVVLLRMERSVGSERTVDATSVLLELSDVAELRDDIVVVVSTVMVRVAVVCVVVNNGVVVSRVVLATVVIIGVVGTNVVLATVVDTVVVGCIKITNKR